MMEQPSRAFAPVTKRRPCPICTHPDWCEIHTQSGAVHCMRTESAHKSEHRGGGWWHNVPGPDAKTGRVVWSPEDFAASGEDTRPPGADTQTKHAVYTALLALCPLSPAHRAQLLGPTRQLPEGALANYGTLPEGTAQTPILAALVAECGRETVLATPGITLDQSRPGGLRFNSHGGLLIPVRDMTGRIQGMQVRADRGEPRYRWLSSAIGASSGTPAHVVRPAQVTTRPVVVLTEGPLKADISAPLLGAPCVAITGVATWRAALPALEEFQEAEGYTAVIIALDADDPAKPRTVEQAETIRQEIAAALVHMGYAVRFARWDHSAGKGLDDLLLGGGKYVLEAYHPQITPPDGGGGSGGEQGDDYAAGLEPGPLSDGKKLRILSNVLLNKHMKPVDKVTLCDIYLLTGAWPGTEQDGALGRRKPLLTLAARVNVGRNTVSKSAGFLQAQGLTTVAIRTEMPPPLTFPHPATPGAGGAAPERPTPKSVAYFHSGRGLGFDEHLPEAEHRISDRKRRCPGCGSDRLVVHAVVCTRCGTVARVPEAEKAAADYERARYAADLAGTTTDAQCTDSVHAPTGDDTGAQDPHAGTAPQASAESAPVPHACTETVRLSVKGGESAKTVHPSESAGACTESVHAPTGDSPPLEWWDDEPEREVAQEWTAEPGATHRPTPAEHGQATTPDEIRRRPHKPAGTTPGEQHSAARSMILGLEAAPDAPALEWERRMQTTAQTARYHGLSPEERAQVDDIYLARREALQGQGPPREAGRQSGAWAVA